MALLAFHLPLEFSQGEVVAEDWGARGERESPLTTPPAFAWFLASGRIPLSTLRLQLPRGGGGGGGSGFRQRLRDGG